MSVKSAVLAALVSAFDQSGLKASPNVVRSTRPEFGDLQCNDVMQLAKLAGKNPRQLAAAVAEAAQGPSFEAVSVAVRVSSTFA